MEELEKKIEYQFIAAPLNLFYVCDVYTYSLLLALIQKETYWKSKGKLSDDDYFFMSIEEISDTIYLFDRGDIRCTIEALYINNIIDVRCNGVGRGAKNRVANEFKINYDKIKEYNEMSIFDIKEFNIRIEKLKRGTKVTYDKQDLEDESRKKVNTDSTQLSTQDSTQLSTQDSTQIASNVATTTIYNIDNKNKKEKIDNLDKIENKNNLNNIEDNIYNNKYSNIYKEKSEIEEAANADVTNGVADANSSFNINLNKSLENNSNKTVISIENKKECNSSIKEESSNREQINSTDVDVNKPNETVNNKNKLKMKQEAKEYFKAIVNEVNYLNRTNSNDVSKLKRYYDVINTLSIDEDDKKEMLDKCNDYIKEISSKKTVNKADSSTLNEKTTDSSIKKKSLNTEPKNDTNANVNKEESLKLQQASRSMEYNRYFNNIQVALSKRCLGTLVQYEKDFQKKVEYLSDEELDDLRNMITDAKHRVQLAMRA